MPAPSLRVARPFATALTLMAIVALSTGMSGSKAEALVDGRVSPGWEPVREAFVENFARRGELGAAVAIYHEGELVVDLWGGWADEGRTRPWVEDTVVPVYSTTKGIAGVAIAHAVSRGLFAYDALVAETWPAFAAGGKAEVSVRQLLGHEAGLAVIDERLEVKDLAYPDRVARSIAGQVPAWRPGERHGYHATTLGLYESALLREADPERRSLGVYWAEEIAAPLELDFHIGLPETTWPQRVAEIVPARVVRVLIELPGYPKRARKDVWDPKSDLVRALSVPEGWDVNDPAFQALEQPSSGGIGSARAVAKVYGLLADDPAAVGISEEVVADLTAPAVDPPEGPLDAILHTETWFRLGFSKPGPELNFGANRRCFGTPGAGGSRGFADPEARLGYAYVMNRMGAEPEGDPRDQALQDAVYEVLGRR